MITPISKYRKLRSKKKKELAQNLLKTSYFSRGWAEHRPPTDICGACDCQATQKGECEGFHPRTMRWERILDDLVGEGACHHKGPYK